jgi:hypothetical protein
MKRRYYAIFTVLLILQLLFGLTYPVAAAEKDFAYQTGDGGLTIVGYLGRDSRIEFPESIDGKPVVAIDIQDMNWAINSFVEIKEIFIPKSVNQINIEGLWYLSSLTEIVVDPGNTQFASLDGVLYNHERTVILWIPSGRGDPSFTLPATLLSIDFPGHEPTNILNRLNLEDIQVDPANKVFSSLDGVLYNKDRSTLIYYPPRRPASAWVVPTGVRQIAAGAFYGCERLEQVMLPENLTSIGDFAFMNCERLKELSLPVGIVSLGPNAFNSCFSLQTLTVDRGNMFFSSDEGVLYDKQQTRLIKYPEDKASTSYTLPDSVTVIDAGAFRECSGLNLVVLGNQVRSIGAGAFDHCSNLGYINLPDSIRDLGDFAFQYCFSLTEIELPAGIGEVPDGLFSECMQLSRIIIPDSVTVIGQDAFSGCSALQDIQLPDGIRQIGSGAFKQCDLRQIVLPAQLTEVSDGLCSSCVNLSDVTIQGHVTRIGINAFQGCRQITSLALPASLTSLEDGVLAGMKSLESVRVENGNPAFSSREGVLYNQDQTRILYYPPQLKSAEYIMPDTVTSFTPGLFSKTMNLNRIVLSSRIKILDREAFRGCAFVTQFVLPENLEVIGDQCFADCTYLASIDLPASITKIGLKAFSQCLSLEAVFFWGKSPELGQDVFDGCAKGLSVYYLPDNQPSFSDLSLGYPVQAFIPDRLMVRFLNWDGQNLQTDFVLPGKAARPPISPVREGYRFTGWDKIFDHVFDNMTITAQFVVKTPSPSYKRPASMVAGIAFLIVLAASSLIFGKRIKNRIIRAHQRNLKN